MDLGIDADELATCVSCGLCLPHCPTFRVTGDEARSPRGRIAAMRAVQLDGAPVDDAFVEAVDTCVQCRGCETACPSAVPFGRLIEPTRATLVGGRSHSGRTTGSDRRTDAHGRTGHRVGLPGRTGGHHRSEDGEARSRARGWRRARLVRRALPILAHPRVLRAATTVGALAQRTGVLPAAVGSRLGLPGTLPVRPGPLRAAAARPGEPTVWLFVGCVMDAWQRDVHRAVAEVIVATGAGVRLPGTGATCCGALHLHAGHEADAARLAQRVIGAFPGDDPVVVDSAGCGAALADYGHLLGTAEARAFARRVVDVHTWLAGRLDRLPPARRRVGGRVAVQDPCHLRHVQKVHLAVRTVLAPFADELVELDDDGLCCGAGGAFALVQPELAGAIRDRKVAAIARAAPDVVASANPGCALHLAGAGVPTLHPLELVAAALRA